MGVCVLELDLNTCKILNFICFTKCAVIKMHKHSSQFGIVGVGIGMFPVWGLETLEFWPSGPSSAWPVVLMKCLFARDEVYMGLGRSGWDLEFWSPRGKMCV